MTSKNKAHDRSAVKAYLDFLRFSLDAEATLPPSAATIDWADMLQFASDQSIVGVLFHGIKRLRADDPHPTARELAKWGVTASAIADANHEAYDDACHVINIIYRRYGHKSCLLKGQGNALMYPDPYMRSSGDIDLWILPNEGETVTDIIRLCRTIDPTCELDYHHCDASLPIKTHLELHYRAAYSENIFYNRRLQQYFEEVKKDQYNNIVYLPDSMGWLNVPTDSMNRILQMSHVMKHFLFEGIGLRQIIDYYYLLRRGTTSKEKEDFKQKARWLGMWKFARGLMYVLNHYLGLEERFLIAPQSRRVGEYIIRDVIKTGNFGFSDKRFTHLKSHNANVIAFYSVVRCLRNFLEFPAEALFGHPAFILWWHFYYRYKMARSL